MEQQLVRQFCSPDADTLMFQVTDEQPIHPSELMRISNANGSIYEHSAGTSTTITVAINKKRYSD